MNFTYLLLLALAPAIVLLRYIWKKDKAKEPFKMLLILFLLGVVSCIPAAMAESATESFFSAFFDNNSYLYQFFYAFFGVALVEEGFKFLVMYLYTRKHKEFNSLFDGMVYAIFVSLGFAAFENVLYVMEGGARVALARAIMSVPGHMFFAVFMGYYYSLWHTYKLCHDTENYFAGIGYIIPRPPKYEYQGYLARALVVPVLVHGFYDFCLFTQNAVFVFAVLALVIALYFVCFGRIKKIAKADLEDYTLIPMIICSKYPELIGVINPKKVMATYSNITKEQAIQLATVQHREDEQREAYEKMQQASYATHQNYYQQPMQNPYQQPQQNGYYQYPQNPQQPPDYPRQ